MTMIGSIARRLTGAPYLTLAGLFAVASSQAALAHGDHGEGGGGVILPAGITLVSTTYDFVAFRPISDAKLTALAAQGVGEVHSLKSIAVPSVSIAHGVTKDFTIAARLPYLANKEIRETDVDGPGVNPRGGVYGFGDVSFTGTYRVVTDLPSSFDAAVILGVKAPTGRTNAVDQNGILFETEHQPGSGSWDLMLGGAMSKQVGLTTFSANTLYTFAGDGSQNTRLGDRLSYGVTASYRLWASGSPSGSGTGHAHPMRLGLGRDGRFDGMMRHGGIDHAPVQSSIITTDVTLGLNGQWSGKQRVNGERDDNTGGHVVYLTPGVKLSVDQWAGFVSVGIPVIRELTGIQSDPRLQVTTGMSVKF
jgi:Putative MetA-pathway of phenol degradation